MPIKSDASQDLVQRLLTLEQQADECYQKLEFLLKNAWNVSVWASLVIAAEHVEALPRAEYGGMTHRITLQNLSRIIPIMCEWSQRHAKPKTEPASKFRWTNARRSSTSAAFGIAAQYFYFCATFPAWHRNLLAADLINESTVLFRSLGSPEERRVSAYNKGIGAFPAANAQLPRVERPPEMEELIIKALGTVRATALGISYPTPERLLKYLNDTYQHRLASAFRRQQSISVGRYSLKDFRTAYASVLAIAAAHEHIAFRWSLGRRYPFDSSVLHNTKQWWIDRISFFSGVSPAIVASVVNDLTLGATRLLDAMIHPFVSLDDEHRRIGLLPHFVLASNSEENILRTCSLIRPRFHHAASAAKELEMLEELCSVKSTRRLIGPIKLRGDLPDIDLLVEDLPTDTIAVCELKWGRKPYSALEHISRNAELAHGAQQLQAIQTFLQNHPEFLKERKMLSKRVGDYRRAQYLLVARDHLTWIPPDGCRAIVGFNPFKAALEGPDFSAALDQLLSYKWLPEEGKHFAVHFKDATANGVTVRSEHFYPV